ncbi:MAG: GlcG/HbpS family heme-binding protein [Gemmatimonadota bacterium]
MRRTLAHTAAVAAAAAALALVAPAAKPTLAQTTPVRPVLTLETAGEVATAARRYADERDWAVVVAIVDAGGHLLLLERMDGAQLGSIDVAWQKARSAVLFRRPTREIQGWVDDGNVAVLGLTGAVPLAGGRPVRLAGEVVGAVGISGMTAAEDDEIARAALARLDTSQRSPASSDREVDDDGDDGG